MSVNWNQPSTQRGIAMLVAGALQIALGREVSVDMMHAVVGSLIGVMMVASGLIGIFRGDTPAPPTRPPTDSADSKSEWMRNDSMPTDHQSPIRNDSGFNNR